MDSRDAGFGSIAKQSLQNSAKLSKNSRSDQGEVALSPPPPEYATDWLVDYNTDYLFRPFLEHSCAKLEATLSVRYT